ncbi:MAG TPA: four helix bundle protein [Fimbriimonas sp.]|nr:four helix bundle protein [Fimbriimonas sp.]
MLVRNHRDLIVYQKALDLATDLHHIAATYPKHELYSMTDQTRRSSRSVCSNIAEAWGKRRYIAAFRAKLNDSEAEAYETQVWLDMAVRCGYIEERTRDEFCERYDGLLRGLSGMIHPAEDWCKPE